MAKRKKNFLTCLVRRGSFLWVLKRKNDGERRGMQQTLLWQRPYNGARYIARDVWCGSGRLLLLLLLSKIGRQLYYLPKPQGVRQCSAVMGSSATKSGKKKTKERILVKNSGVLLAMGRWPKRGELWFLKASLPAAQQVTCREVMQPHWQMKSEAARRGSHWRGNTKKKNKILSLSSRSVPTRPVPLTHT